MKLNEFSLTHYGPLPEKGRIILDQFNLFFGNNESGKTLTIDAIVKLLFGSDIRYLQGINRVDEKPEGYLIIKDDNNKELKFKGHEDFQKICDISPSEFSNLFIIRDSDLDISNETDFYTKITDRLLGLRTDDLKKIEKNLQDIGKITSTGIFRNIKDEKIKDRLDDSEKISKEIIELNETVVNENFSTIEMDLIQIKEDIAKISQELDNLEIARKRDRFKRGNQALESLKTYKTKFEEIKDFNNQESQAWRENETIIFTNKRKKEQINSKISEKKETIKNLKSEIGNMEYDIVSPRNINEQLQDDINPELKDYEKRIGELANQIGKDKFILLTLKITTILLFVSIFLDLIFPIVWSYAITFLFALVAVVAFFFKILLIHKRAYTNGIFERIKYKLSKYELSAETSQEILANINKFKVEYEKNETRISNLKKEKEKAEEKIDELRTEEIPAIDMNILNAQNVIDNIKTKSGAADLQDYIENVDLKNNYEKDISNQLSILEDFGAFDKNEEKSINNWENEIKKIESFQDKAIGILYSEDKVRDLKDKKESLEKQYEELDQRLKDFQEKLRDIERRTTSVLQMSEESVICTSSNDLININCQIWDFIEEYNQTREDILEVIKIFKLIEIEGKERASEILNKESLTSEYFKTITDEAYQNVIFDVDSGRVKVTRKEGVILEIDQLSGGTYDQINLAIRLALGEKILKDKVGFLIMDDPFIKSDQKRLQNQINLLKKIAQIGWQIIYFSCKSEIPIVLAEDISNGSVNYIQMEDLAF